LDHVGSDPADAVPIDGFTQKSAGMGYRRSDGSTYPAFTGRWAARSLSRS
jgi:hypothetical protein